MADKTFYVIAECVDERDGKRYFPGDTFPKPTRAQAQRLTGAKCLSDEKPDLAELADQARANDQTIQFTDDLGDKTVAQLRELATAETIDLGNASRKPEILAAIRKGRQARTA